MKKQSWLKGKSILEAGEAIMQCAIAYPGKSQFWEKTPG